MASLIPGFEYDIFISYRQKDNRGEQWVSEFVEALKTELESTFKEEVSVYFDINPHDGLLETHDVGESLKDKLKCLVFIPIISRTYCDPKSFALENEFKAFVEEASQDQFGLKVRLSNGNVASRVLPVKIHELDADDLNLCESLLGGSLRGIDFIYKEPGINKPLSAGDDEKINLNKTKYRYQINKAANAIHEIIHALTKNTQKGVHNSTVPLKQFNSNRIKRPFFLTLIILSLLLIPGYIFHDSIISLFNPKITNLRDESVIKVEVINNTVNSVKTRDPELIAYLIKFNLSNKYNLTLLDEIQFNKIHPYVRGTVNLPRKIIYFKVIIGESLNKDEIDLKITDNQNHLTTEKKINFSYITDLLNFTGDLDKIASYLGASITKRNYLTSDWNSIKDFYKGEKEWGIRNKVDAIQAYQTSFDRDPSFILPYLRLANIYHHTQDDETSREYIDIVIRSIDKLAVSDSLRARALWHILNYETPEAINNFKQLIELMPAQKEAYFDLAEAYFRNCDIEDAREYYTKSLKIDPDFTLSHNHLAYCFSAIGMHDSALIHVRRYLQLDSSANAWDSYGDILFAMGDLDNASLAKKRGLELDPRLDYLYESLAYINVQQLMIREALHNIDTYIALQKEQNIISRGMTDKAFIYFVKKEFIRSLDTCLKAKQIYDSKDLLTRNHILHWILARLYIELNDPAGLNSELKEMEEIITKNKVDGYNNYNMILKFYYDIKIRQLFTKKKTDEARQLISKFDKEIYEKVKDWNYPFDLAFFNSEFGKLYLEVDRLDLAKERFEQALKYNPKYLLAHIGLAVYFNKMKDSTEYNFHFEQFYSTIKNADAEVLPLFKKEYEELIMN